jgi:type VI secretion system secreted protein VgrG
MSNVGLAYSLNVGAMMNVVVGKNLSSQIGKNQTTKVGTKYSLTVGGSEGGEGEKKTSEVQIDGKSIALNSDSIRLTAKQEIVLVCGSSTIRVSPDKIEILSTLVNINC